jgi:DNA-binding transcriptional MerR regulator
MCPNRYKNKEQGNIELQYVNSVNKIIQVYNVTVLCYIDNRREFSKMSEELISKKDLLELTGISYGQLYRWKRKDLIPEEWFVRKSTFTGQETFFPKEKILDRINKIQEMKENLSLDELAEMFSPNISDLNLNKDELIKRNIVSEAVLQFYLENDVRGSQFDLSRVVEVYILEKLLQSGDINLEEGKMIFHVLKDNEEVIKQKSCEIIMTRKLGVSSCLLLINAEDFHVEKGTKVIARVPLLQLLEEIKTKLG